MSKLYFDGDFDSNKDSCKYHSACGVETPSLSSLSCHPAQVGPKWVYGCRHPAWPQNREKDFEPMVNCKGDIKNCEMIKCKWVGKYIGGLKRHIKNKHAQLEKLKEQLIEIEKLKNG